MTIVLLTVSTLASAIRNCSPSTGAKVPSRETAIVPLCHYCTVCDCWRCCANPQRGRFGSAMTRSAPTSSVNASIFNGQGCDGLHVTRDVRTRVVSASIQGTSRLRSLCDNRREDAMRQTKDLRHFSVTFPCFGRTVWRGFGMLSASQESPRSCGGASSIVITLLAITKCDAHLSHIDTLTRPGDVAFRHQRGSDCLDAYGASSYEATPLVALFCILWWGFCTRIVRAEDPGLRWRSDAGVVKRGDGRFDVSMTLHI